MPVRRGKLCCPSSGNFAAVVNKGVVACTCYIHMKDGHCPHQYVVEELEKIEIRSGHMFRGAAEGAAAIRAGEDDIGSSGDEAGSSRVPKRPQQSQTGGSAKKPRGVGH